MSSTQADLLDLSLSAQTFSTATRTSIRPPTTFLSLAPTTSSSYAPASLVNSTTSKKDRTISSNIVSGETIPMAAELEDKSVDDVELLKTRRSSSLGSDGSDGGAKKRFLKLCPVHGDDEDGKGDWSEDVLTE